MTANAIKFGYELLASAKLSANCSQKIGMAWHHWTNRSQQHIATPFIRTIRDIFNGLEASHLVS
jgi:hypothetical protein